MPSDSELASEALQEEAILRFPQFKSEDAVTIGMNLRKRFRASSRHAKGKGCVISIQTMQGATLFACSVGEGSDVSLDSWWRVEGMIKVVRRTGHSTFYVERGLAAIGRNGDQLGLSFPEYRIDGGGSCLILFIELCFNLDSKSPAFPVWLQSSPISPVAVIAVYSGSSPEDHHVSITNGAMSDFITDHSETFLVNRHNTPVLFLQNGWQPALSKHHRSTRPLGES